jgi:hypothetical protein
MEKFHFQAEMNGLAGRAWNRNTVAPHTRLPALLWVSRCLPALPWDTLRVATGHLQWP